jgi:hypothetical protein
MQTYKYLFFPSASSPLGETPPLEKTDRWSQSKHLCRPKKSLSYGLHVWDSLLFGIRCCFKD